MSKNLLIAIPAIFLLAAAGSANAGRITWDRSTMSAEASSEVLTWTKIIEAVECNGLDTTLLLHNANWDDAWISDDGGGGGAGNRPMSGFSLFILG